MSQLEACSNSDQLIKRLEDISFMCMILSRQALELSEEVSTKRLNYSPWEDRSLGCLTGKLIRITQIGDKVGVFSESL